MKAGGGRVSEGHDRYKYNHVQTTMAVTHITSHRFSIKSLLLDGVSDSRLKYTNTLCLLYKHKDTFSGSDI